MILDQFYSRESISTHCSASYSDFFKCDWCMSQDPTNPFVFYLVSPEPINEKLQASEIFKQGKIN